MARIKVRKGMPSVTLDKAMFAKRLKERFAGQINDWMRRSIRCGRRTVS